MKRIVSLVFVLLLTGTVHATWLAPSEKTDPLTGEKVTAHVMLSYGSYIYNWPSKYDLVFWPLTDEKWICLNPKTGYGAFNDDFEEVSDEEKKTLTEWLAKNYKPSQAPESHGDKLVWLEKVYGQRQMDDDFWSRFYRLMAYVHREDKDTSLAYVSKALSLLQKKLQQNPEGIDKLEVLYLLGEYYRRLGENEKVQEYFAQVKKLKKVKYEDDNEQTYHRYIMGLVKDRRKLKKNRSSN